MPGIGLAGGEAGGAGECWVKEAMRAAPVSVYVGGGAYGGEAVG